MQDGPAEQFLLSLIRFVQFATSKTNPSTFERALLNQAKSVFTQLAKQCEISAGSRKSSNPTAAIDELTIEPLPGNFKFEKGTYTEQSPRNKKTSKKTPSKDAKTRKTTA